ncbi:MAG: glycerophosphodiester phosphodiesterase, partial [Moraxellaceae bacterium]
ITSFDLKVLQALQLHHSLFKRGLLVELPFGEAIIPIAQQLGCTRIGLKDAFATQELIEKIRQAQLLCSVWTVNDIERAKQLASWHIDGLITDVPSQMLAAHIGP